MSTHRSTPALAVGFVAPVFACVICGTETATMPLLEVRTTCCKCAGEHPEFEYGYCVECGEELEYSPCDDDVTFGGGYRIGDPIGILASAMNGNAADRHKNPESWDRWVAFCNENGHP